MEAADLLENFTAYWEESENVNQPKEAQRQLPVEEVERVYVCDDRSVQP